MPEKILGNIPENDEKKYEQMVLPGFETNDEKEKKESASPIETLNEIIEEHTDKEKKDVDNKEHLTNKEPSKDNIDVIADKNKTSKNKDVNNKSEFLPDIQKKNKLTLKDILMAPIRFLKFIFDKIVAFLDRYTGYNDLNIKSPDVIAAERNKGAKTASELKDKALILGAKDKDLSEKAKDFERLLNNTYGLDGRTFKVSPIKYQGFEPMLNVETIINGKTYIDTIGINSNCCLHTNTSSYGITNGLNAAWTKYIGTKNSHEEIDSATKVLHNKINEIARSVINSKNPVYKHVQNGLMLNGVYLHVSSTSALKGEPSVTIRPYLVTQKGQSNSIVFPGLNKEYTFALSECSNNNPDFVNFVSDIRKTSKEYYNQSFERDMNSIMDKVIANNINNFIKLSSPDLAENLSVRPMGIDKDLVKLEIVCDSNIEEITLNKSGNIIGGCNNSEKQLVEMLARDTVSTLTPSNICITKDALESNIRKTHDKIKSAQSKGKDGMDVEQKFKVGNSRIIISKTENVDKDNIDLNIKQYSLADDTEKMSAVINVNSDAKDFLNIANRINENNLEFANKQSELIADKSNELFKNIIVEHNLEIDPDTLKCTVVDLDEKFKEFDNDKEERPSVDKDKEVDETSL